MLPGIPDVIRYFLNLIRRQPRLEGTAEQLQQTSLDDQNSAPSPKMVQQLLNDHTNASGDNWKTVSHHTNGQHEGRSRSGTGTSAHKHCGEHRSSREGHSQSHSRTQSARSRNLESDLRKLTSEHESLKQNYGKLLEERQATITNLRETQMTCKGRQQEIDGLRERLRTNSTLLDARNQELKVARTFLSKEDPLSTSDVAQSVLDLNSEIMQTAAHLVESLPPKQFRAPLAEGVPEELYKSITPVFPQGPGGEVDMGSLELALRGFLVSHAFEISNIWSLSYPAIWYDQLYSKVCETEDHTVASNWRVITRRTLSHMDSSCEDLSGRALNDMVIQLANLLSSHGVGDLVHNVNHIQRRGSEKLKTLFIAARKLNKMIGENIVSEDLVVSFVCGGAMFNGEFMEDAYGARAGSNPGQRAVICTTDLGLCERGEGKGVRKILLKPKVVLHDG